MLRQLHRAEIFEILLINISTVQLSNSAMRRYCTIASLYQKFINTNKKIKQRRLVKFPDHVFIDFDIIYQ